ncbi:hypothetical protein EMCRGX_G020625 [Ephydatia muelleri]|eukprot:Em0016g579a
MPPKFKRAPEAADKDKVRLLGLDSSDEEEENIFVNSNPDAPHASARAGSKDPKIKQVQTQVSKVIGVMKDNISKVMERGEKLDDLEEKSGELADSATRFRHSSRRLQQKLWWQQCKWKCIIAALIAFIIIIIIAVIIKISRG